jgi:hypothetical protein
MLAPRLSDISGYTFGILVCKCSNDWIDDNHHLSIHVKNAVNLCPACVALHVNHRFWGFLGLRLLLYINRMHDINSFRKGKIQS